jgi:outer membrane protein OmpA-like peptidoglycan-associated protein
MSVKNVLGVGRAQHHEQEEHWIPLSDLMTGLMMMFMLVAVLFMVKVNGDKEKLNNLVEQTKKQAALLENQALQVKSVVKDFDALRERLYDDLNAEFRSDLLKWGAELDHDLTVRFKEPDVLFGTGEAKLKARFIEILDDFFPRYARLLTQPEYRGAIDEVRIEGHTSSIWNVSIAGDQAYFKNMELSQQRTRSTLEHVLMLPKVQSQKVWLIGHLTANGLSSSKLRRNVDGTENSTISQRVEFRVRMNSDARLAEIRDQPLGSAK